MKFSNEFSVTQFLSQTYSQKDLMRLWSKTIGEKNEDVIFDNHQDATNFYNTETPKYDLLDWAQPK